MIRRRSPRYYKGEFLDIARALWDGKALNDNLVSFERACAQYVGTRYAVTACSGRNALELLLDAFEFKAGDEIILPAYTLKNLVWLIQQKGLVPKFVDIDRDSMNLDPQKLSSEITPKTKAIIATHLFGLPCQIEKISAIAKQRGLIVLEDCAHALGASIHGKRVGSFGDAAFFSFETIKPMNTFGGGMVTTDHEKIALCLRAAQQEYAFPKFGLFKKISVSLLEDSLIKSPFYPLVAKGLAQEQTRRLMSAVYVSLHNTARTNRVRFTPLQAHLGLRQLTDLDDKSRKRSEIARSLKAQLDPSVKIQTDTTETDRIYYFFVITLSLRGRRIEEIRRALVASGIDCGICGEITDHCPRDLNQGGHYPVTDEIYDTAIQLPMHDEITEQEVSKIADAVNRQTRN